MAAPLQAKLLRVLQEKTVRPVGGSEEVPIDFRVVSATNHDLPARVREGAFREDLYYRIAVLPIRLPALRERPEDVPALARHFLARVGSTRAEGFSDDALARLRAHRWPGNVRELQNAVERAAALARGPLITPAELTLETDAPDSRQRPTLAELERRYIEQVMAECGGDKRRAAAVLGVSVRTLQRFFPTR
jgi:DNA-binding NtrC family response regulator